ncbi:MAG: hypothetical protein ACRDWD_09765 [Acidimicrobiia bacterium]
MLLVAGELIDEGTPVVVEPYADANDPWDDWLRDHLDTDSLCWLAGRRSPTPLEPICFGEVPTREAYERHGEEAFDAVIGLNVPRPERLVVAGWLRTSDHDQYVNLHLSSALVSPETSLALLRALQTAPPREYRLPYAGEGDDFDRTEITVPGFELCGWLDDVEVLWTGLDDHDPVAVRHASGRTLPSDDFRAFYDARVDSTGCRVETVGGQEIARVEIWGDGAGPGEREDSPLSSEGNRTWVATDSLLRYLEHRERDLIIEVGVRMYAKSNGGRRSREEEEDHGYEESRIYLLRHDGTVETIERRRQPWKADRH